MANKIGRNEKCPCGSGKKYKHCCLQKGVKYTKNTQEKSQSGTSFLRTYFQDFHKFDLVATLAALSIYPPNHGKNLRLEYLTLEALSVQSESKKQVNPKKLNSFLYKHFGHHHLEDPPGNLFTENIIYTLGNNTVYGGNFEQGSFTLNTIISAIQFNRDSFPKEFLQTINDAFLLLLTMSDLVASRAGHKRNMYGEHESSGSEIEFPSNILDFRDALFFSNDWIEEFCGNLKIDKGIISHFSLDEEDRNNPDNEVADNKNPLITKPLAQLTNGVLLVSPTSIVSSLIHFAWVQAEKFGHRKELLQQFHKTVWEELSFFTSKIKFEIEKFDFEKDDNLPIKNAVFRFDSDKLAYLSFIYDEGEKYNTKTPCHSDPMTKMEEVQKLQDKNFDLLRNKFKDYKFIDLTLYSTIGREYMLMFPERDNTHSFIWSVYKFLCWIKSESHDNMSLWYFLESKNRFLNSLQFVVPTIGFLDYYNLYRKNKSFYLGDDKRPDGFFLVDGALNIIKDATKNEDKIIVYHKVNDISHPVLVPVMKFGDYIPRYFNIDSIGQQLEYYIPGYPIDIWLRAKNNAREIPKKNFHLYWEVSEAICYWLWQVREQLNPHMKPLNKFSLLISFELMNIELFESHESFGNKDNSSADKFAFKIEPDKIEIKVPGEISGHISSSDNEGERIILKQILLSLGQLLDNHNLDNTLSQEVIENIVNERLPLGLKKMLLFIDTKYSIALDPRNVDSARLIQDARKQWYMDEVIPMLGRKCPPEGEIEDKDEKQKLTKNIVFALLKELKKILQNYNSKELLFEIMKNYESILHENALSRLRTPTRLHCFAEQEDIVAEIQKKTEVTDETSLVLRCLIEHLSAEPSFGNSPISQQIIDDIVALMSLIVWWGGVGDKIRYDLFEVELAVLHSRRIGTNSRQISEQFFHQFSEIRVKEYIEDSVDSFSSHFIEEESKKIPVPEGFNNAFTKEVGIRFDKLGGIVSLLVDIGFEQNSTISKLTMPEIIVEVKKSFDEPFTADEIQKGIKFLSLWNRDDVIKIPDGFINIDISPWRYNRKLSYLQRPLIFIDYGEEKDNPMIYWTPRHLNHSWMFLNHLFMSGRYRAEEKSDLERQISIITKKRGTVVQKEVIGWFSENTKCFIDEEVEISPSGKLKSLSNLGDSDVFTIDHEKKVIYSIECKRTDQAKNSKQMVEQVQQYFGAGSKKGYFDKHLRRHSWLESNLSQIGEVYDFDSSGYTIVSFFVTYEILAIQFMNNRPLPIPMFSLFELKDMDYDKLYSSLIE